MWQAPKPLLFVESNPPKIQFLCGKPLETIFFVATSYKPFSEWEAFKNNFPYGKSLETIFVVEVP